MTIRRFTPTQRAASIAESSSHLDEALGLYERLAIEATGAAVKAQAERKVEELRAKVEAHAPRSAGETSAEPASDATDSGEPGTP